MAVKYVKSIDFKFGDKHLEYMRKCIISTWNVAEGAVRAGKTIDNVYAFAYVLKTHDAQFFLATGSTLANAKLNIGEANGYGLAHIFKGQCRWGKYLENDCLYIKGPATNNKQKIVIFAGGALKNSFMKVRGNSYGMWIATEINNHHDEMIKECKKRTFQDPNRKIFWDLNPSNPNASIYTKFINNIEKKSSEGNPRFNFQKFTIMDNITISKKKLAEILEEYDDKEGVDYRRDILGERCSSEGIIYGRFANKPEQYILKFDSDSLRKQWFSDAYFISIGIDIGGHKSLTTFVATVIHKNYGKLTVVKEHHIPGKKGKNDPDEINTHFIDFYRELKFEFPGVRIARIYVDNAEQVIMNGLRKACTSNGISTSINDSNKRTVIERIRCANSLFSIHSMFILDTCTILADGIKNAMWDEQAAEKGIDKRKDDFTSDIDILDAWEYSWSDFMNKLILSK